MAEELKPEEKQEEKKDIKQILSTVFKVILGLVFLGLGVWAIIAWWRDLLLVVKGCIGLFLLLAGVITLAIARE
ncbi:MAG: hypothetical protein NC928_01195 [Candidatus Omnitrophica bacterium]|nr:hypothetical protein [Candidatus Omnitrophota bacterium]